MHGHLFQRRKIVAPPWAFELASPRLSPHIEFFDAVGIEAETGVGDALNVLAQIPPHLGGFDGLQPIVRVEGHVASAHCFFGQPAVVDGASDLFAAVLSDKAGDARSAFSQRELPPDATVIPVVIAEIRHT
ncbi:yjgF/chorismate mutase-like, endoribonuclease family protein [Burkholderia multivorans]|uniref:YjgF/chorismate mutase-like, endoribonuclease family protein n=1 Tax=Burkholderia multivorans TaxID=87883 RepID=A0ABD7LIK0_9BURK|nr:yjgF/chorismate mutase-like, endoribonuclease family protein [Burkholderia multivorans]SAK21637.1 yjgF/chorismate mutase-like, endoribonuclease family protein [Burkholderia multivorans]